MGILDKLTGKKQEPKTVSTTATADSVSSAPEKKSESSGSKSSSNRAYANLIRPLLTEKATAHASTGRYVFQITDRANKSEVKKSIEQIYDVHVRAVKIIHLPAKKRRTGRTMGKTSPIKKAIVVLKSGEKISGIIETAS